MVIKAMQPSTRAGEPGSGEPVRVAGYLAALFMVTGVQIPFYPIWLGSIGLTPEQIAAILATPPAVRVLVLPALTVLADRLGGGRLVIAGYSWIGVLAFVAVASSQTFLVLLGLSCLIGLVWGALIPLTDAAALGTREKGGDYGRIRVWGSLGFVAASLAGGAVLDAFSPASVPWLLVGTAACCGLMALRLPAGIPLPEGVSWRHGARELMQPRLLLLILGAGLVLSSHAFLNGFSTLHWRDLGLSGTTIGALWSIGVVGEVALFWYSTRVLARTGAFGLLVLGAAGAVARWVGTGFDPPLAVLFALQAGHALSFAAVHLGCVHALGAIAPQGLAGTTQGLYTVASGIATALAIAASGPLYRDFAGQAYWAMAALAAVGLCLIGLARPQPQKAASAGETRLPS